jgi:hypothetical protein
MTTGGGAVSGSSNRKNQKMKLASAIELPGSRKVALTTAMVLAVLLLALAGTAREARATFPGHNGKIAFASNRTTGEGVNNPEGDLEIFTMNRDGTGPSSSPRTPPSTSTPIGLRTGRRSPSKAAGIVFRRSS